MESDQATSETYQEAFDNLHSLYEQNLIEETVYKSIREGIKGDLFDEDSLERIANANPEELDEFLTGR
tara:strand:- start:891 stop:1094 length:204 start_codon:yes stop_codon:yes gene_type:complete